MPRTSFQNEILQVTLIRDTVLRHFYCLTHPCAANWFTCYKEERHSGVSIRYCLSSLATCSPTVDLFQITQLNFQRELLMAISFFFLFSQSSHACVSASTRGHGAYTGPIFVGCLESEDRRPMTPSKTKTLENEILSVRQKIDGTTLRSVTYCGNNLFRHSTLCLYASKPLCSITSVYVQGKS